MRQKERIMNGIATATEVVGMAAALVDMIRQRSSMARKSAEKIAGNLRDTADAAGRLSKDVRKQIYGGPSVTGRILLFAAGFGAGVGTGLLFAPSPGTQTRAKLVKTVSGSRWAGRGEELRTNVG